MIVMYMYSSPDRYGSHVSLVAHIVQKSDHADKSRVIIVRIFQVIPLKRHGHTREVYEPSEVEMRGLSLNSLFIEAFDKICDKALVSASIMLSVASRMSLCTPRPKQFTLIERP